MILPRPICQAACLLLGLAALLPAEAESADRGDFDGWPPGWVSSYRRFEDFITVRRASWPAANLQILPDGMITHEVRLWESRSEHLTLDVFRDGQLILGMGMADHLLGQGRSGTFVPGTYAACLKASTSVGYQYLYPLVWFEVEPRAENAANAGRDPRIRIIEAPVRSDALWPNERLLQFLDFDIFPRGHPWDIEKVNRKVQPNAVLRLSAEGVIERALFSDPVWESQLHWRVYHEGRLVEKGAGGGAARWETKSGPGTYHVWLGVEGPGGFMPISNMLSFPLFPSGGKYVVVPPDANGNAMPDLLESLVMLDGIVDPSADRDNDGIPDVQESAAGDLVPKSNATDEEKRLVELWNGWSYTLRNRSPVSRPAP